MANDATTLTEVDPRMVPCPRALTAPPCPLHGGPVPDLALGGIAGSVDEHDPAPGAGQFLFGRCDVCGGAMQVSPEGLPIRVEPEARPD